MGKYALLYQNKNKKIDKDCLIFQVLRAIMFGIVCSGLKKPTRTLSSFDMIGANFLTLQTKKQKISAVKPATIFFVLLTGLSLSARAADSDCARLLAPSFQSREPGTEQKFRAYMENLLEEAVLGYDELKSFSKTLEEGVLANPVTEEVGLRNYEADVHRSSLQEYVDSGELDVKELGKWALERLEKMERDRSRKETVSEEIKEIVDIDVTSRVFWEQGTDRYLKYIPVGEKIPGSGGKEAIHFAAQLAPPETFKKFVDIHQKDLNVNTQDDNGATPLMYAARSGNPDTIKAIIKAGADVNATDNDGRTALMYAAMYGNADAIETLAGLGAEVNATDKHGSTALMHAAMYGHVDAIETLARLGAEVNATNKYGLTALTYAARNGHLNAIKTLARLGTDVNATTTQYFEWNALIYAAMYGHVDAIKNPCRTRCRCQCHRRIRMDCPDVCGKQRTGRCDQNPWRTRRRYRCHRQQRTDCPDICGKKRTP